MTHTGLCDVQTTTVTRTTTLDLVTESKITDRIELNSISVQFIVQPASLAITVNRPHALLLQELTVVTRRDVTS
jgi:hypothetical protein